MSTADAKLDPTAKTLNEDLTPQQKIDDLHVIIKACSAGMLTTRGPDGHLHSRAMAPCGPVSPSQTTLYFLANNVTHKFDDLENDSNVNVSFYDTATTSWVSYDAKAKVSQDRELIKTHWNSTQHPGYFGDLKDGKHDGTYNDPRVSIIEVIPNEIRYWVSSKHTIVKTVQMAVSSLTGHGTAPGELRIISGAEIGLTQGLQTKH